MKKVAVLAVLFVALIAWNQSVVKAEDAVAAPASAECGCSCAPSCVCGPACDCGPGCGCCGPVIIKRGCFGRTWVYARPAYYCAPVPVCRTWCGPRYYTRGYYWRAGCGW
ncbi:MAG: hypothetical protein ACRC10_12350 [Thermoguttaceae bacterium]